MRRRHRFGLVQAIILAILTCWTLSACSLPMVDQGAAPENYVGLYEGQWSPQAALGLAEKISLAGTWQFWVTEDGRLDGRLTGLDGQEHFISGTVNRFGSFSLSQDKDWSPVIDLAGRINRSGENPAVVTDRCFVAGGACRAAGRPVETIQVPMSLTILHTNDTHTHLDPEDITLQINGVKTITRAGGYARLATKIKELRGSPDVLLLHAGDAIQGSLYGVKFRGAETMAFFNLMNFTAMVVGNHEFDYGPEVLTKRIKEARFPILGANVNGARDLNLSQGGRSLLRPFIIRLVKGQPVAIIGLITETTKHSSSPGPDITFDEAKTIAAFYVSRLEKMGVNKIVLLTHLGFDQDKKLAREVPGIDVIVGGHSHSLLGPEDNPWGLTTAGRYPTIVQVPSAEANRHACIVQAWEFGKVLGRLEVSFDENGVVTNCSGTSHVLLAENPKQSGGGMPSADIQPPRANSFEVAYTPEDQAVADRLAVYQQGVQAMRREIVGQAAEKLPGGSDFRLPTAQAPTGSLVAAHVAAAMLKKARANGLDVRIALQNAGGVRQSLEQGPISVADVFNVLPFSNTMVVLRLTGAQIKETLEIALDHALKPDSQSTGAFPYLSGGRFAVDAGKPLGQRITRLEVQDPAGSWGPIDPAANYLVAVNNYVAGGGDFYTTLKSHPGYRSDTGFIDNELFMEYIKGQGALGPIPTNVDLNGFQPF